MIIVVCCFFFFVNGVFFIDGCLVVVCKLWVGFLLILLRKWFDSVVNKICLMIILIEVVKKL